MGAQDALIEGLSYAPGASKLTLVNGAVDTGYSGIFEGRDLGNTDWEQLYSGPRGTQGARLSDAIPRNRSLVLPFRVRGSSKDQLHDRLTAMHSLADDLRRYGGRVTWRGEGQTYKQYFEVLAGFASISDWPRRYEHSHFITQVLSGVCAPYLLGDPYDIFDGFDTDTSSDYTKDADGALLSIAGGVLFPNSTGSSRWRHTARGFVYGDCQATVKFTTGSTVTSLNVGIFINGDTAGIETFFSAEVVGGNLNLVKRLAGVPTTLVGTAFTPSTSTSYWLQIRREGRVLTASLYSSQPTPLSTPTKTISAILTAKENAHTPYGHAGLRLDVVSLAESYDEFRVEPFTYSNNLLAPDERALRPQIIGDGPAVVDLVVTQSGGSVIPIWALAGWWERPSVWNYIDNGDFEDDVDGWSTAGQIGITGACTSFVRSTSAPRTKYGTANGQIVCPATANTGVVRRINRRFYQGREYIVLLWASSAAGTTNARVRLGVSGDIASSTPVALSPTPTLFAATWVPTADRDGAYIAAEITAATGTTWNIDAVDVFESRPAVSTTQINAGGSLADVERIPEDWATPPFNAILANAEIVRVERYTSATQLFLTRALEGTTSITIAAPANISPLPAIQSQYEGKGAQPPVGVIEAESDDSGNRFTWALVGASGGRLLNVLEATGLNGAGSVAADWLVDPHLLVPDDYTQGEIAVEVWARMNVSAGLTNPKAILAVAPETATVASGVLNSNFGAIRYTEEYGATGKSLVPSSSGNAYRLRRLGTIRLRVDASRPLRSRLQLRVTWTAASAATVSCDYLVLVPANARCLSPSGKVNDANFPKFIASTAETTKIVRSDLSGLVAKPPLPAHPDHGLGGSLVEFPGPNMDLVLKLSELVPDDPTSDTSTEASGERPPGSLHAAVTPRFTIARGSS